MHQRAVRVRQHVDLAPSARRQNLPERRGRLVVSKRPQELARQNRLRDVWLQQDHDRSVRKRVGAQEERNERRVLRQPNAQTVKHDERRRVGTGARRESGAVQVRQPALLAHLEAAASRALDGEVRQRVGHQIACERPRACTHRVDRQPHHPRLGLAARLGRLQQRPVHLALRVVSRMLAIVAAFAGRVLREASPLPRLEQL